MTKQQEFRKQTEEAKFEAFSLMCKKVADLEKVCKDLSEKFDYQVKQVMKLERELENERNLNAEIKARFVKCNTCTDEMKDKCLMFSENLCEGERCEELVDLMALVSKNDLQKENEHLKEQIADIKANCDLAIEGRDIKIKELEQKITQLEKQIVALEAKNIELSENWRADHDTLVFYDEKLEKENAELEEQISTKDILIKELQEQKVYWKESSFDWRHKFFKKGSTKRLVQKSEQLTKAKEIIKQFLNDYPVITKELLDKLEQFIKEIEK